MAATGKEPSLSWQSALALQRDKVLGKMVLSDLRYSIQKIVWLLHALSPTDQLIIPSLLSPPSPLISFGCCHFPGALQIENSEETDQGKYECVASNVEGVRYSSPANLYVRGREQPEPRARPKNKTNPPILFQSVCTVQLSFRWLLLLNVIND